MAREHKYFTLTLESLRAVGSWAADRAERALPVYEQHTGSDSRPRAAIEGIRAFAAGGRRTAQLRTLALSAHAAAREAGDPAAAAAARAAGSAAASAYTHPLADVHQTKHILGPAAYAALALELDHAGDQNIGDGEVRSAIEHVTPEVREVLLQMPARQPGNSRLDTLLYKLDAGIRGQIVIPKVELVWTISGDPYPVLAFWQSGPRPPGQRVRHELRELSDPKVRRRWALHRHLGQSGQRRWPV